MMHFTDRKKAFTLAEVLITLMVVGIVAALTIPTLAGNIQKTILKNQIKQSFSMYSQIFERVKNDPTVRIETVNWFGYQALNDAVLENLKIIKTCKGNALENGCIEKYEGLNVTECSGFNETNVYNNQTIYVLSNNTILIPYHNDWKSLWLVDINGKKGPNKAGYDLFQVDFSADDGLIFLGRGCINKPTIEGSFSGAIKKVTDIDKW